MAPLRTLDEIVKLKIQVKGRGSVSVSRRTLQLWLSDGRLKGWKIEGDRRRFIDLAELKRLLEPRIHTPKQLPIPPKP